MRAVNTVLTYILLHTVWMEVAVFATVTSTSVWKGYYI